MNNNNKVFAQGWRDYELIDAGGGKKLERWGDIITIRPELQAYFKSGLSFVEWYNLAHWEFTEKKGQSGNWKSLQPAPQQWQITYKNIHFNLELTKFKHLGLFPEQQLNWEKLKDCVTPDSRFLNLFAYTGAASIIAKSLGADVTHVDSVKQLISWSKRNMESSELEDIRWIHDDAFKFAKRQKNKGAKFDVIVMDPPAWGIGANKEKWKLETHLPQLMEVAFDILENDGWLIVNTYSPKINTEDLFKIANKFFSPDQIDVNELWMKTYSKKDLFFGCLLHAKKG